MNSMGNGPLDGPAFKGYRAAGYQKILDDLRHAITTMGDEAMKAHADAQAAPDPVEKDRADERAPAPEERCS